MSEDADFVKAAKQTVTILRPMPSVLPRGFASDNVQQPTTSIRFREEQLEAMTEAASILGMSRSQFIQWCAYYVAVDILQQYNEYKKRK